MLYTREEVELWLAGKAFPFAKYSSEFGWLLPNARGNARPETSPLSEGPDDPAVERLSVNPVGSNGRLG